MAFGSRSSDIPAHSRRPSRYHLSSAVGQNGRAIREATKHLVSSCDRPPDQTGRGVREPNADGEERVFLPMIVWLLWILIVALVLFWKGATTTTDPTRTSS
jgi:hypothetical protein